VPIREHQESADHGKAKRHQFWIATTVGVASMLLLELKGALEGLTKRIAGDEILTFTKS
jgi:hypothetical protein